MGKSVRFGIIGCGLMGRGVRQRRLAVGSILRRISPTSADRGLRCKSVQPEMVLPITFLPFNMSMTTIGNF